MNARITRSCARIFPLMNDPIVHILASSLVQYHLSFMMAYVDEGRKQKAMRYVNQKDRLLSLGGGYLLRKYLPKGEIKETKDGKPYIENGPFFNLSHSGQYVVLAIHPTREVGVDIERIDEKKLDAIRFVLSPEEKEIEDVDTLFRLWSNKESLIKCKSTGLKDIKAVSGLPLEGARREDKEDYYTTSMIYERYSLSLTLKGKEPFYMNINRIDILEEE